MNAGSAGVHSAPRAVAAHLFSRVEMRRLLLAGAALAIGMAGIVFGLRELPKRSATQPGVVFQKLEISQLTGTGRVEGAAISPDGKYVAYGVWEAGRASLWVRQVGPANSQQLIPPAEARYSDLSFSRDGDYIYYARSEKDNPPPALFRVPVLGGVPQKLLANVGEYVTLSPDETRVAFTRLDRDRGECALVIANLDGGGERKLAARPLADPYQFPAWSPDGKAIACTTGRANAGGPDMGVVAVRVEDGSERPIMPRKWQWVGQKAWLADGSGLVLVARQQGDANRLWRLSYPGGAAQKLTSDSTAYLSVSAAADANALVAVQTRLTSDIWIAPEGDAARARRLAAAHSGLAWTPDGRIVYASSASGNPDIWMMNADGTGQKQLTADAGQNIGAAVSPDGRYIVFMSNRNSPAWHIWRMGMDGSNPTQLTFGGGEQTPVFTPDGRWVLYTSVSDWTQWKVPVAGGDPARVTDGYAPMPPSPLTAGGWPGLTARAGRVSRSIKSWLCCLRTGGL
ncbi:MAG TPA: hypothetical protein VNO70_05215 [Blastocatellia bacterium]|nr:hypothetical protein [Blastocatellia bacterium]